MATVDPAKAVNEQPARIVPPSRKVIAIKNFMVRFTNEDGVCTPVRRRDQPCYYMILRWGTRFSHLKMLTVLPSWPGRIKKVVRIAESYLPGVMTWSIGLLYENRVLQPPQGWQGALPFSFRNHPLRGKRQSRLDHPLCHLANFRVPFPSHP